MASLFDSMAEHPYHGQTAVIATLHSKEQWVGPPLWDRLGMRLQVAAVDTDSLGTFSGEVERTAGPLETAIRKARLGMASAGAALGFASEGSIGPDPWLGFVPSDIETLVLVDDERGITVSETVRSLEVVACQTTILPTEFDDAWLTRAGFPSHGLLVHPEGSFDRAMSKGLCDRSQLMEAIDRAHRVSATGRVTIANDLRAHFSPTRQRVIRTVAERLAARLAMCCSACGSPGWGAVTPIFGMPCADCGTWVESARMGTRLSCPACGDGIEICSVEEKAAPSCCPWCNP